MGLSFCSEVQGNTLRLSHRELTDENLWRTITKEVIGGIDSIQILDLDYNNLTTLPPEIARFRLLQFLDLSDNNLTMLPPEIGNLPYLYSLHLQNNLLTTLPSQIGNLKKLQKLSLINNKLALFAVWQMPRAAA